MAKMHLQLRICAALSEDANPLPSSHSSAALVTGQLRPLPWTDTCTHMRNFHLGIMRNKLNLLES